jgi:hypothetical protein
VLVIDDDLASAAALQDELQRRSFIVLGIEFSPRRLLRAIAHKRPDVIILNVHEEWPELDFVIFQAMCGGAKVLLVGNHSHSFWAGSNFTSVTYLPGSASARGIVDTAARIFGFGRRAA